MCILHTSQLGLVAAKQDRAALELSSCISPHGRNKVAFSPVGPCVPYLLALCSLSSLCKLGADLKHISNSVMEFEGPLGPYGKDT